MNAPYGILINKLAVPEPDLHKWAKWFGRANRRVAETQIGGVYISTVFVGLDHAIMSDVPLLFETMVFRGGHGQEYERYSTWQQAEAGHKCWVSKIKAEITENVNK